MVEDTLPQHWIANNLSFGSGQITYNWSWGDSTTSTGAAPVHVYSSPNYYEICLTVIDAAGCTDTYCNFDNYISRPSSTPITVQVIDNTITSLNEPVEQKSLLAYPNPVSDKIFIKNAKSDYDIFIYDLLGHIVIKETICEKKNFIDIRKLNNGVYILKSTDNKINCRIIITK